MDESTSARAETPADLAERVGSRAQRARLTVAVAESLTGGAVATALAAAPAAGRWFAGGVVAYQDHVKFEVLGVEPGPVATAECARQMVVGVRRLLRADVAVAVTGVGGPEPDEGQPAGRAYLAVAGPGGDVDVQRLDAPGDPVEVVACTVVRALSMLADAIS